MINFILPYVALFLFLIVYIVDEITMLFVNVKNRKWYQVTSQRKYSKAFKIDVFANWLFPDTWNLTLGKKGYKFGKFGETLSSCIGRKKLESSLSWFGLALYFTLYIIDFTKWKKGGHCFNSIMTDEQIENFIK